jgi:hypothetical protein
MSANSQDAFKETPFSSIAMRRVSVALLANGRGAQSSGSTAWTADSQCPSRSLYLMRPSERFAGVKVAEGIALAGGLYDSESSPTLALL